MRTRSTRKKKKKPEIAELIFGTKEETIDVARLQKRIADLKANPRADDPDWWNNFAGAYIQLGQPQNAVDLLEPILGKFKDDYGIHANLGTAYHLLGRYKEAEKEIARDLEINPDAHFGLEKYHLALLQYLSRDQEYQKQHVYVDEFSNVFLRQEWSALGLMHPVWDDEVLTSGSLTNDLPSYRLKWNLAGNTNLERGVIYMASLNPRDPACFVMLGIICLNKTPNRDLNLAAAAFEKAVKLNSPQTAILESRIASIKSHIRSARGPGVFLLIVGVFSAFLLIAACIKFLRFIARTPSKSAS